MILKASGLPSLSWPDLARVVCSQCSNCQCSVYRRVQVQWAWKKKRQFKTKTHVFLKVSAIWDNDFGCFALEFAKSWYANVNDIFLTANIIQFALEKKGSNNEETMKKIKNQYPVIGNIWKFLHIFPGNFDANYYLSSWIIFYFS